MVTSAPHKRLKLRLGLAEWLPTGTYEAAKQVSQLASFVMHICSAVRPGFFLLHRLLA